MDHASIIDGCRLTHGDVLKFRHNDMKDLKRVLQNHNGRGKLIIVDGVFSMEGDIANLPILWNWHSSTVRGSWWTMPWHRRAGKTGRGTAEHFGLESEVDLIMGTYSKSLASIGGFIAGSEQVIHYIKHFARALIFSASPPPHRSLL